MHTAFELKRSMITIEVGGLPASRENVLDWDRRDRLGIVIDSPLGALGAGLLVLLCTTAFYDLEKQRRRRPLYAPIYLFHVGRGWGFHGEFDFWPDRKEIIVSDPAQTLPLINSHGITHLAVPEHKSKSSKHRYKEPEDLLDRLKQAFLYGPDGIVNNRSFVLHSSDGNVIQNFARTANREETLALREIEVADDPRWHQDTPEGIDARHYVNVMRARLPEISPSDHAAARARERIRLAQEKHLLTEAITKIDPQEVLSVLG